MSAAPMVEVSSPESDAVLPHGWREVPVKDILHLQNGFPFKPNQWSTKGRPIIRIQNLNQRDAPFNYFEGDLHEKFLVNSGDLLFAWSGTPGTSFGAHIWQGGEAWLNQHIFNVKFKVADLNKEFIRLAINRNLSDYIEQANGGVGLAHITKAKFDQSLLLVPPKPVQDAIVAELARLAPVVDSAADRLTSIPALLKKFRQSVLGAACSGQLTTDWRESNVHEEWREMTLSEVILAKPKNGYSAKPVGYETPWKVLTLTATTSGTFDPTKFKFFNEVIPDDSPFWVCDGDIFFQRGNTIEYVGVPALYRGEDKQFIYPDLMMRVRANSRVLPEFLVLACANEKARQYLRDHATGSQGSMPKINQPTLMSLPLSVPGLKEQTEIVHRVESLFALADSIESRLAEATAQVERTTQAILAKAFRGELRQ